MSLLLLRPSESESSAKSASAVARRDDARIDKFSLPYGQPARHGGRDDGAQVASRRIGERLEERDKLPLLIVGQVEGTLEPRVERSEDRRDRRLVAMIRSPEHRVELRDVVRTQRFGDVVVVTDHRLQRGVRAVM